MQLCFNADLAWASFIPLVSAVSTATLAWEKAGAITHNAFLVVPTAHKSARYFITHITPFATATLACQVITHDRLGQCGCLLVNAGLT